MRTAKEIATNIAAQAREMYEADGYASVATWALDGEGYGVMLLPNPEVGLPMREHIALLMGVVSAGMPEMRFAAFVVESWVKAFPEGGVPESMQRGYLESIADTDPEVKTNVMVMVIDIKERDKSHSVMSIAGGDDPRVIEWDISEIEGLMEGAMPTQILNLVDADEAPPPGTTIDQLLEYLVDSGLCLAAARYGKEEFDARAN